MPAHSNISDKHSYGYNVFRGRRYNGFSHRDFLNNGQRLSLAVVTHYAICGKVLIIVRRARREVIAGQNKLVCQSRNGAARLILAINSTI